MVSLNDILSQVYLSFDRPPHLFDGVEIGKVWGKVCEVDIVFSSIVPDENRVVRTEIVQHDNQAFIWVYPLEFLEYLPISSCLERSRKVTMEFPLTAKMPKVLARIFSVFFTNGVRPNDHIR